MNQNTEINFDNYSLEELWWWQHLLRKRAEHTEDEQKQKEYLSEADAYEDVYGDRIELM